MRNSNPAGGAKRSFGILIISDILLYREGVAAGIATFDGLAVLGAVGRDQATSAIRDAKPDAVLLDISTLEALDFARSIRMRAPDTPIVGFGIGSDAVSLACAEAGLTGFVGRDGTLAELAQTVTRALAGEVGCSPRLAALFCARLAALSGMRPARSGSPLTSREQEIAELVANGLSNKEIAIELHIGPATVKNHIHNILEKLKVPRRGAIGGRLRMVAG